MSIPGALRGTYLAEPSSLTCFRLCHIDPTTHNTESDDFVDEGALSEAHVSSAWLPRLLRVPTSHVTATIPNAVEF